MHDLKVQLLVERLLIHDAGCFRASFCNGHMSSASSVQALVICHSGTQHSAAADHFLDHVRDQIYDVIVSWTPGPLSLASLASCHCPLSIPTASLYRQRFELLLLLSCRT